MAWLGIMAGSWRGSGRPDGSEGKGMGFECGEEATTKGWGREEVELPAGGVIVDLVDV